MQSAPEEGVSAQRVERRKAESRQRLLAAARQLFIERGYHETRPQDITRAADLGHGTFYLHFADKRECFVAFAEAARAELRAFVEARVAGIEGVEPQFRAILDALLDYAEQNPGALKAAMTDLSVISSNGAESESVVDRWAVAWAARVRQGAEVGAFHDDYHPEVAGRAIVGLIRGATGSGRRQIPRAELIDTVTRFLVRALVPEGAAAAQRHRLLQGEDQS